MSDFVRMGDTPIHSVAAAASLSLADAQLAELRQGQVDNPHHLPLSCGAISLTLLIGLVAMAGVASALFSMWIEDSMIAFIAFAFPLITGPCILVQRQRLQWMPSKSVLFVDSKKIITCSFFPCF